MLDTPSTGGSSILCWQSVVSLCLCASPHSLLSKVTCGHHSINWPMTCSIQLPNQPINQWKAQSNQPISSLATGKAQSSRVRMMLWLLRTVPEDYCGMASGLECSVLPVCQVREGSKQEQQQGLQHGTAPRLASHLWLYLFLSEENVLLLLLLLLLCYYYFIQGFVNRRLYEMLT